MTLSARNKLIGKIEEIQLGGMIAHWFSATFSLGAWVAALALLAFAWIGRSIATAEASAPAAH